MEEEAAVFLLFRNVLYDISGAVTKPAAGKSERRLCSLKRFEVEEKEEKQMKKTKKLLIAALTAALCFSFAACGGEEKAAEPEGPAVPETANMETLEVYLDGQTVKEEGFTYDDLSGSMEQKESDGTLYYGLTVDKLLDDGAADVKTVFFEAADGFISCSTDPAKAFLTAYTADAEGEYQPIELDGKQYYGGFIEGGMFGTGVNKVYLSTTDCDWNVDIQVDGTSVGSLNMEDFMKKTPMGSEKAPTAMYDASFMYKQGAATYKGKFLGFDLEQMTAKLKALKMEIPDKYKNVEFTGTSGMGKEGLNTEYNTDKNSPWYMGNVKFFAMYDGKTYCEIGTQKVGLTAFIDGQGMRWMTYSLSTINFVTK